MNDGGSCALALIFVSSSFVTPSTPGLQTSSSAPPSNHKDMSLSFFESFFFFHLDDGPASRNGVRVWVCWTKSQLLWYNALPNWWWWWWCRILFFFFFLVFNDFSFKRGRRSNNKKWEKMLRVIEMMKLVCLNEFLLLLPHILQSDPWWWWYYMMMIL